MPVFFKEQKVFLPKKMSVIHEKNMDNISLGNWNENCLFKLIPLFLAFACMYKMKMTFKTGH